MHQIRNELALMRWRSNGAWACAGGDSRAHRRLSHRRLRSTTRNRARASSRTFPGCAWCFPRTRSTPTACCAPPFAATIRCCFLSTSGSTARPIGRAPYPGPEFAIPFGKAKIVRPGTHITLVTYGALVPRALQAAERAQREHGIDVEILDLRTLNPYDWEAIATSVRKTSRVIVAHEDMLSWGYGAEIAARIGDELFDDLDAPVKAHRLHGYLCRLPAGARGRDSSPARNHPQGDCRTQKLLEVIS